MSFSLNERGHSLDDVGYTDEGRDDSRVNHKEVYSRPLSDDGESVSSDSNDRRMKEVQRDLFADEGGADETGCPEDRATVREADEKSDDGPRQQHMDNGNEEIMTDSIPPRSGAPLSDDSEMFERTSQADEGESSSYQQGDFAENGESRSCQQKHSAEFAINRHEPIVCERLYRNHKHVRQTVIRQDRHQTVRQHILLPVHEKIFEETPTTVIELPERGEEVMTGELSEEAVDRSMAIHTELAQRTQIATPEITHEYIDEQPSIEERVIRHTVKEIHPIIERDVHITHVIREVKQINRKLIDPDRVTGLHIAEAVSLDEWEERLKSGTDDEYIERYLFDDKI